jgi:hypothetical protein
MKVDMKIALLVAVAVISVSAILVWVLYPRDIRVESSRDDFEKGLGGWSIASDVPEDPNNPGKLVEWRIERSSNQSVSGSHSILFAIDGSQDDGTIWIQRELDVEPNVRKTVAIAFQFWSPSESFNTLAAVVGYAGNAEPKVEEDLQVIGEADKATGWKMYSYSAEVPADGDRLFVALGISVRWETTLEYFVDDVTVTIK